MCQIEILFFRFLSIEHRRESCAHIMSNWDDEDFEVSAAPVIASKGKWEGEDEDDEDIPVAPFPLLACDLWCEWMLIVG